MGDISELRGLIVAITFMGVFAVLALLIPPQLYTKAATQTYRNVQPPQYFEALDLQYFAEKKEFALSEQDWMGAYTFTFGGRDLVIYYWFESKYPSVVEGVQIIHWEHWLIFTTGHHPMWTCSKTSGNQITAHPDHIITPTTLETNFDKNLNTSAFITKCDHFQMYTYFAYNMSLYSSITEAFYGRGLHMLLCINFDQVNTSFNAWNLIGMMLFFQLPNVHWAINALLAIPIYACVAYVAMILILRVIGAIFGGGGS